MTKPALVDSHVNLHSEKFAEDLAEVIARARDAGVSAMLTICDKLSSIDTIAAIADARSGVWRSVGVHPHYAKDYANLTSERLLQLAAPGKVIGVGECGLDFYYLYSEQEAQERVFRAHVEAARESGLPLIIHTRDADEAMQAILEEEYGKGAFTPLLHCYTGGIQLAEAVIGMGGFVSFSGIITFKNASDLRAVASKLPLERIIVETDCPYLAPVPMRGRRCEPAHVVHVAAKLAEIRGISVEETAKITTENFYRLFSRARPEERIP
ncbi:MAG: TatD family hydrolase [Pseudomonadota bacterium]|nr:TatD family hydrolase [Pseudomonadota bacterium]